MPPQTSRPPHSRGAGADNDSDRAGGRVGMGRGRPGAQREPPAAIRPWLGGAGGRGRWAEPAPHGARRGSSLRSVRWPRGVVVRATRRRRGRRGPYARAQQTTWTRQQKEKNTRGSPRHPPACNDAAAVATRAASPRPSPRLWRRGTPAVTLVRGGHRDGRAPPPTVGSGHGHPAVEAVRGPPLCTRNNGPNPQGVGLEGGGGMQRQLTVVAPPAAGAECLQAEKKKNAPALRSAGSRPLPRPRC